MKIRKGNPYRASDVGLDDPDGVLWGIFVGGCVDERGAWRLWEDARSHAHNGHDDPWRGWVCILDPKDVLTPTGKMTSTLAHEVAHLMCKDHFHSRAWKREITKMGYGSEIARCGLKPL
jgi:hypothetical protein